MPEHLITGSITAGTGVTITGTGDIATPYVINASGSVSTSYNPTSYGAVGNGTTDDTANFQAALTAAAATGGTVKAGKGLNFLISAPLRVSSNCTLDLTDCTLTLATGSNTNLIQNFAVQANRRVVDGVTTSSSTTFTSATAAFVSGDTGSKIRIYYQNGTYLDTTITYASATTVTLATAATQSGTALYASIGAGRDSNIKVFGGKIVRSTGNGAGTYNGWDAHSIRFRHCDYFDIGNINITNNSGKYDVNAGDCTNFNIHDIIAPTNQSDTVHINGPSSNGYIDHIVSNAPYDDVVALTGGDYHGGSTQWCGDVMGNITDISISRVTSGAPGGNYPRAVSVIGGQSGASNAYTLDRIVITDVRSKLNNYPVWIGGDTADPYTTGGAYGRIIIDTVINTAVGTPPGAAVATVANAAITYLEVRSVFDVGASCYLYISPGSTVGTLVTASILPSYVVNSGTVTTMDIQTGVTLTTTGTSGAATYSNGALNIPQYSGGSGGITRSINAITAAITAGATANTDYTYYWTGSTVYALTLPTAVGNTNRYSVKNTGSVNQAVAFTSSQTADGSTSVTLIPNQELDFVSNNANWMIE